jgi:predicted RNA-binding protein YlxR (DUF448 family)
VKPPYFHDGLEDFVQLVVPILRERGLFPPTTRARRCAIIDAAEVDDQAIRIVGSKDILQAAIDSKQTDNGKCWWFCSQVARHFILQRDMRARTETPALRHSSE